MLKKCRRKLEQQTEAKQEWPCPVREIKNLMVMVKGHTWEAACQRRTTMGNRWSKFIVRSKATEPQRGRGILITLQLRAPGSRRQAPEQLFLFFRARREKRTMGKINRSERKNGTSKNN